ncbi:MAG TPA: putative zinc-binding protein [Verrucomicrobiae bacterium]
MSDSENLPHKGGTVVYACSGCSDAGELADRIARRLTREGAAEMSCLAGIGGRVKPLVNKAASAERILAIDGCPLNCTRHTLELAGFKNFEHLELQKLGMRKNSCPVTEERIVEGVEAARKLLARSVDESKPLVEPIVLRLPLEATMPEIQIP